MDNMLEAKKDSLRQMQGGEIKLGFTIQHADMPDFLYSDPMGKRYYVVFVDADVYDESNKPANDIDVASKTTEKSEGERLRTRAIMLCKDDLFLQYIAVLDTEYARTDIGYAPTENAARLAICYYCNIKSRSELAHNKNAQEAFNVLLRNFREWKVSNQYADNLSRE